MTALSISRRSLLKTTAFGLAGASLNLGAAGRAFAAKDLTVGVVYVGARDDFGWNQAHAVAIKPLKEVPGVKVAEEENVPETDAVSKSMESMINLDGAGLILATSFGYYTPFVSTSRRNILTSSSAMPRRSGTRTRIRRTPAPISAISIRLTTSTASPRGCRPIQQARIRRRQADRERAEQHQFVHAGRAKGQPQRHRAGDLYRRLVAAGARGGIRQRAGRRRLRRHHVPRRRTESGDRDGREARRQELRPQCEAGAARAQGFITGAEYKWITIYKGYADDLAEGKTLPNFTAGGYEVDFVQNTPFGAGATEAARPRRSPRSPTESEEADLCRPAEGQQDGKVVIDKTYDNLDPFLDKMDYLLEGVVGSTT